MHFPFSPVRPDVPPILFCDKDLGVIIVQVVHQAMSASAYPRYVITVDTVLCVSS
jgi:hypothetical protein